MTLSFASSVFGMLLMLGVSNGEAEVAASGKIGECQIMTQELTPKYHLDTACDRMGQNEFRANMNRFATWKRLQGTGPQRVPTEKTVICPEDVKDISGGEGSLTGFDTVWLVENTASTPVVVSWVDSNSGIEYSAFNSKITPPSADPEAIMQPGTWRTYFTFEGHVFHVRELLEDGTTGNVLMQHRPGLYPIRNKYGPPDLFCNPNDPDPEPVIEETGEREEIYARTPPANGRPCNTIDVGFRNEVGCPLHVFYTGMQTANATTGESTCYEDFKFHMGTQPHPQDFMWDWASQTKYEGSFIGHNFVFRLASDPSIIMDQVTLQPTLISDCPNLKQRDATKVATLVTAMGVMQPISIHPNITDATAAYASNSTTSSYAAPRISSRYFPASMGSL